LNNYLEKYPKHVILHPHSNNGGEDMQSFYNQIGFLLCASIYESFHCAIMEAGSAGCIPIVYEYFQKDVPKTPEEYVIYKFKNEDDIVNFITTINEYENKSLKIQKYYEIIIKKNLEKYDELIEKIVTDESVHNFSKYLIGVILHKSNNILLLQNKIIEISNQNTEIFLTIFINKKDYVANNVTFIKCWRKGYLFGNSTVKIPFSIKSVKIIMREPIEEEYKNYNILV